MDPHIEEDMAKQRCENNAAIRLGLTTLAEIQPQMMTIMRHGPTTKGDLAVMRTCLCMVLMMLANEKSEEVEAGMRGKS